MTDRGSLSTEDATLVTLARSARARAGGTEGAAVRDADGRTYSAASVALPSLRLSALQVCVAMAVSSGSRGLEAAVVLLNDSAALADSDRAALGDFAGPGVPVHVAGHDGSVTVTMST